MKSAGRLTIIALFGLATLAATWGQQGGSIEYGQTVEDRITSERGDEWTFSGREGDEVRIEMTSSSMDTYLELQDGNRNVLALNDDEDGTDSLIEGYVLPRTDRYTIVARGYAGETGPYALSLERTASGIEVGTGGGELEYGETVRGRLTVAAGDEWTFRGSEGDEIRIAMQSDLIDSYVELLGPDGELLVSDDDGGGNLNSLIEGYVLSDSGTYTIVANSFSGDMGAYSLSLELTDTGIEIRQGGEIGFDETISGRVLTERGDEWTFTAGAGDVVTISMDSTSLDTYLELYGPDGRLLAANDDSVQGTDSLIENFWLEEGGEYTIVARGYSGNIGPYRLRLERLHEGGGAAGETNTLLIGGLVAVSLLCLMFAVVAGVLGVVLVMERRETAEE